MKATITIHGMHCNSCQMLIQDVLDEAPGIIHAKVSKEHNNAIVEFDEKITSKEKLCKLIEAENYKAE